MTSLGPGIESLSGHLLRLMRKGVTVLQNVFFLKCCLEYGIHPRWNILMRIPGEEYEDYQEMTELISKLLHLAPPFGIGKIQCHRFSPYFTESGTFTENIRPEPWYEALFPPEKIDLARVAYSFKANWKNVLTEEAYQGLTDQAQKWRKLWTANTKKPGLIIIPGSTKEKLSIPLSIPFSIPLRIQDTRTKKLKIHQLNTVESLIYDLIKNPLGLKKIIALCSKQAENLSEQEIRASLAKFIKTDLAITEKGQYLALAIDENQGGKNDLSC